MHQRRAPQVARGLKYNEGIGTERKSRSRPASGAWVEIDMASIASNAATGRAPQVARGLKYNISGSICTSLRRAPQVARGLKYDTAIPTYSDSPSRPASGAWVEIGAKGDTDTSANGRAPQGARGLKCRVCCVRCDGYRLSRPARGAWVEIPSTALSLCRIRSSRPASGAWVEIAVRPR